MIIWVSHTTHGAFIEILGNPQRVRAFIAEELFCPNAGNEEERICRELAELRLPHYWKKVYRHEKVQVIATHFVDRRKPSEEAVRLWRMDMLRAIEDLPKKYPTLYAQSSEKKG